MVIVNDCERIEWNSNEIMIKIDFQYFYNKKNKNE